MARPISQGIPYFPLDTDFDDDVELFLAETESNGFAVLISLWQIVYKNDGYFCNYDNFLLPKLKKRCHVPIEIIEQIIYKMADYNIIDSSLFNEHKIVTSRGIQKRYFSAAKRKTQIQVRFEFILIDVSEYNNIVIVDNNRVNVNINTLKQSKAKQIKLNEIKEKQSSEIPTTENDENNYENIDENKSIIAAQKAALLQSKKIPAAKSNGSVKNMVMNLLISSGMNKEAALLIMTEHNYEFVYKKILHLLCKLQDPETNDIQNPGAYLKKSIQVDFDEPKGFDEWIKNYKKQKINDPYYPDELKELLL